VGDLMNSSDERARWCWHEPTRYDSGLRLQGRHIQSYGMFSKGGFSKSLSNLKGTFWNQDAWNASDSNFWGGVQGVAKSPAAGAAGMNARDQRTVRIAAWDMDGRS